MNLIDAFICFIVWKTNKVYHQGIRAQVCGLPSDHEMCAGPDVNGLHTLRGLSDGRNIRTSFHHSFLRQCAKHSHPGLHTFRDQNMSTELMRLCLACLRLDSAWPSQHSPPKHCPCHAPSQAVKCIADCMVKSHGCLIGWSLGG